MADRARYDDNQVPTLLGASNIDGVTPVLIEADPATHELLVKASVSFAANSSVNVNQIGGTAVDANSGNKSAGTLRVVIATDQPQLTNALKVDGSAITQPVSGTITANAGTNLNTSALALESGGNLATLAGAVTSSVVQTNVKQMNGVTVLMGNGTTGTGSQRVTIASDNSAFSVNATLSAETTKVIGVIRAADGSGNLLTSTTNALDVNLKTSAATNISTNVAQVAGTTISTGVGAVGTGVQRVVDANGGGRTLASAGGSASTSGNNTLVAAGTNKLKVYAFSLSTTSTTAMTCIFQSGAGGTEIWRVILQAPTSISTGANLVVPVPSYIFATASATLLNLNLSSANAVHWSVSYFDEA